MGLADVVAPESLAEPQGRYLTDLMGRGVVGTADAVVFPSSVEEAAAVMRWCYETDTPLTARGGGTGLAGGAIPVEGGIVLGFDRLNKVRQYDPLLWRMHVEAGVTTGDIQRLARESGLRFPPDPGAAEISQIGGNIACNAGGPHAFKYGVTGNWVTGIEAVIPPGEIIHLGGPIRKDVAGYDVKNLLVDWDGSVGHGPSENNRPNSITVALQRRSSASRSSARRRDPRSAAQCVHGPFTSRSPFDWSQPPG